MTALPETETPLTVRQAVVETLLLCLLMFIHGGDMVPGINEAHYLPKAKSFWEPTWIPNDLFLQSGKAHLVFDVTFGSLTAVTSLPVATWLGRSIGWLLLSVGLVRLSWRVIPIRFASLWTGLLWMIAVAYGNLAGEWIVGGIEAKVPAYAFTLFALERWLSPRPQQAWIFLGIASAFHVLVGGWTVVALLICAALDRQQRSAWRQHLLPLTIGGTISLLGLIPALRLSQDVPPELARQAATIYTFQRISHHLIATSFQTQWFIRFGVVAGVAAVYLGMLRNDPAIRRLAAIVASAAAIACVGGVLSLLASVWPDFIASILRFYWFRLADAIIPLCGSLAVVSLVVQQSSSWNTGSFTKVWLRGAGGAIIGAAVLLQAHSWFNRMSIVVPGACRQSLLGLRPNEPLRMQQQAYEDWRKVCQWIADNTSSDTVVLTPRHQQTFKWYTGRAEVVCWKDVPQDAAHLIEWSRRIAEVFPARLGGSRVTINYKSLRKFHEEYGAEYLISDRRVFGGSLPLVRVYPDFAETNETFEVYRVPTTQSRSE